MDYERAQALMLANMQILNLAGIGGNIALETAAAETLKATGVDFSGLIRTTGEIGSNVCQACASGEALDERIVRLLEYAAPLTAAVIANRVKSRVDDVGPILRRLEREGRVKQEPTGRRYKRKPVIAWLPA